MKVPLFCRLGYHRFGAWKSEALREGTVGSTRSPRETRIRVRTCAACSLTHRDYSPQIGMLVTPPKPA